MKEFLMSHLIYNFLHEGDVKFYVKGFLEFYHFVQDDRYSKYIGKMAIVPMTFGRHVPIISDRVRAFEYHCS